jgi:hypothetical protein
MYLPSVCSQVILLFPMSYFIVPDDETMLPDCNEPMDGSMTKTKNK